MNASLVRCRTFGVSFPYYMNWNGTRSFHTGWRFGTLLKPWPASYLTICLLISVTLHLLLATYMVIYLMFLMQTHSASAKGTLRKQESSLVMCKSRSQWRKIWSMHINRIEVLRLQDSLQFLDCIIGSIVPKCLYLKSFWLMQHHDYILAMFKVTVTSFKILHGQAIALDQRGPSELQGNK
jgi:hypothetical protein